MIVPANKVLFAGTVPANKVSFAGNVKFSPLIFFLKIVTGVGGVQSRLYFFLYCMARKHQGQNASAQSYGQPAHLRGVSLTFQDSSVK